MNLLEGLAIVVALTFVIRAALNLLDLREERRWAERQQHVDGRLDGVAAGSAGAQQEAVTPVL